MPNPHFRVSHISRAAGQNAVASAAYRAAETLYYEGSRSALNAAAYQAGETLAEMKEDGQRGQVFDFVRKEGVLHKQVYAPADAPAWASDRQRLWNAVEETENSSTRRASARLATDFVASLPRELSHEEHRLIVGRFVQDEFTRRGLAVDVAFHSVRARDGGQNPHVHMMVTTREIGPDGFGGKARWMKSKETLSRWRTSWEKHTNRVLEAADRPERLNLQTYAAQGIDREGRKSLTREEYVLEEKGIKTRRGDENRAIAERNAARDTEREAEKALEREYRQQQNAEPSEDAMPGDTRETRTAADRELAEHQQRLAAAEGAPDARINSQNEARQRRGASGNADGRTPLWSDFSARVGAEVGAARDAVHRHRQRDALTSHEGKNEERRLSMMSRLKAARSALAQASHMLRNLRQRHVQAAPGAARPQPPARPSPVEQGRTGDYGARFSQTAGSQAVRDVGRTLSGAGVGDGYTTQPPAPAQNGPRQQGLAIGENNARSGTPSAHPTGGASALPSETPVNTARTAEYANRFASNPKMQEAVSLLKQNHESMNAQQTAPRQKAAGQDNSVFKQYGGRAAAEVKGQQKAAQKEGPSL